MNNLSNLVSCDFCKNKIGWGNGMKFNCLHFFCEKCILHSILIFIGEHNKINISAKNILDFPNITEIFNGGFNCLMCDNGKSPFNIRDYLLKAAKRSMIISSIEESEESKCQSCESSVCNYYCIDCQTLFCHSCIFYYHNRIKSFSNHTVNEFKDYEKIDCYNCKKKDTKFFCCEKYFCTNCILLNHLEHNFKYTKNIENKDPSILSIKKNRNEKVVLSSAMHLKLKNYGNTLYSSCNGEKININECEPPLFIDSVIEEIPKLEKLCIPSNDNKNNISINNTNTTLSTFTTSKYDSFAKNKDLLLDTKSNPSNRKSTVLIGNVLKKISNLLQDQKNFYMNNYSDKSKSFQYLNNLKKFIKKIECHIKIAKNLSPDQIKDGSNDILIQLENQEEQVCRILANDLELFKSLVENKKTNYSVYMLNNNPSSKNIITNDETTKSISKLFHSNSKFNSLNFNNSMNSIIIPKEINYLSLYAHSYIKFKTFPQNYFMTIFSHNNSDYLCWLNNDFVEVVEISNIKELVSTAEDGNNYWDLYTSTTNLLQNNQNNSSQNNITTGNKKKINSVNFNNLSSFNENSKIEANKSVNKQSSFNFTSQLLFEDESSIYKEKMTNRIRNKALKSSFNLSMNTNNQSYSNLLHSQSNIDNLKRTRNCSVKMNINKSTLTFKDLNKTTINPDENENDGNKSRKSKTISKNYNSSFYSLCSSKMLRKINHEISISKQISLARPLGYSLNEISTFQNSNRFTLRHHQDKVTFIKPFKYLNESYLVLSSLDKKISLWRCRDFSVIASLKLEGKCFTCEIISSANSFEILTGSFRKNDGISILSNLNLKLTRKIPIEGFIYLIEYLNYKKSFTSELELLLLSVYSTTYSIKIIDYKSENELKSIPMENYLTSVILYDFLCYDRIKHEEKIRKEKERHFRN